MRLFKILTLLYMSWIQNWRRETLRRQRFLQYWQKFENVVFARETCRKQKQMVRQVSGLFTLNVEKYHKKPYFCTVLFAYTNFTLSWESYYGKKPSFTLMHHSF